MAKTVVYPALNVEGEAKLKRLLTTVGEFMGTKIETESVIVLSATVPDDCPSLLTTVNKIAQELKKQPFKPTKPAKPE